MAAEEYKREKGCCVFLFDFFSCCYRKQKREREKESLRRVLARDVVLLRGAIADTSDSARGHVLPVHPLVAVKVVLARVHEDLVGQCGCDIIHCALSESVFSVFFWFCWVGELAEDVFFIFIMDDKEIKQNAAEEPGSMCHHLGRREWRTMPT